LFVFLSANGVRLNTKTEIDTEKAN